MNFSALTKRFDLFQISQQTTFQVVGKIVSSASTLFVLGLITRHYGEVGTGVFTLTLAFLGFFYLATDLGANAYIVPYLLKANSSTIWQKLFGFRVLLALLLILLGFVGISLYPGLDDNFRKLSLVGMFTVLPYAIFTSSNSIFQSRLRYDQAAICLAAGSILMALVTYYFSTNDFPMVYLMVGQLVGWLAIALISLIFLSQSLRVWPDIDFKFIKKLLGDIWPISATLVLNIVYFRIDSFIVTIYHGFWAVGIYNLAFQIFQAALVVPTFIMNSFYPLMIGYLKKSPDSFYLNVKKALIAMLAMGVLGWITTYLLSPVVVSVVAGDKNFSNSVVVLQILAVGFPAFFASSVLMWTLITLSRYKIMLAIYVAGLLFNLGVNLLFIPTLSYYGASWATVVSEYLILLLQLIILRRQLLRDK